MLQPITMKHNYLLLTLLLACSSLFSQSTKPFARPGAHWCVVTSYPQQGVFDNGWDITTTIKNGIECSVMPEVGCLYVQNDTVYRIRDNGNTYFLYDYNAHAGEHWQIFAPEWAKYDVDSLMQVQVDSVKKIAYQGDSLRVISTSMPDAPFSTWYYSLGNVLEGVGTANYLLPGPWGWWDNGQPTLYCYKDSVIGAIQWSANMPEHRDSCVCNVGMGLDEAAIQLPLRFTYRAVQQSLQVLWNEHGIDADYAVYAISGQAVQAGKLNENSIRLPDLAPGVYVLQASAKGFAGAVYRFIVER